MKLSIAIPAYNAAKSLPRTVESILAQTMSDFELLIVNNGSADNTGDVARELAKKDGRIKVFDLYPNVGGYGARLHGWRHATGEFITSVDADDWIDPDMYEKMLGFAEKENLDVVQCEIAGAPTADGSVEILRGGEVFKKYIYPTLVDVGQGAYIWNKIYRNHYDFTQWKDGDFGSYEDLIHNLQLFNGVKSMGFVRKGFYHYEVTPSSVTKNFNIARLRQFKNAEKAKRELVGLYGLSPNDPVLDKWVANDLRNALVSAARTSAKSSFEKVGNLISVIRTPGFKWF